MPFALPAFANFLGSDPVWGLTFICRLRCRMIKSRRPVHKYGRVSYYMSVLFRVYFIHLRRKVQRQDIQAALCYRQPERCVNTGSGDRQCLRRPTFGVEGQRADLLTVQCDLHPSAAFRGHTQCGIVLNTCSFLLI